jgi:hypothetical protein
LSGGLGVAGGLELAQLVEGAFVGALGGVDAALEAFEGALAELVGVAEGVILVEAEGAFHFVLPNLGIDSGKTAELPVAADEGVDKEALLRRGGLEAVEVPGGEGVEVLGALAADDEGLGVDAGFQGILGRGGLAGSRARAGGFPGVEAVGLDLMDSGHDGVSERRRPALVSYSIR